MKMQLRARVCVCVCVCVCVYVWNKELKTHFFIRILVVYSVISVFKPVRPAF